MLKLEPEDTADLRIAYENVRRDWQENKLAQLPESWTPGADARAPEPDTGAMDAVARRLEEPPEAEARADVRRDIEELYRRLVDDGLVTDAEAALVEEAQELAAFASALGRALPTAADCLARAGS